MKTGYHEDNTRRLSVYWYSTTHPSYLAQYITTSSYQIQSILSVFCVFCSGHDWKRNWPSGPSCCSGWSFRGIESKLFSVLNVLFASCLLHCTIVIWLYLTVVHCTCTLCAHCIVTMCNTVCTIVWYFIVCLFLSFWNYPIALSVT